MFNILNSSTWSFIVYFSILTLIGLFFSWKERHKKDFSLTQSRSLNYWVTAISAHASDMSSWLFMGFPAAVTFMGFGQMWVGLGLLICMWANWQFISPKLRVATEKYDTFTLAGYFSQRFQDKGILHIVCAATSLLFFSFYIAAGFVAFGMMFEFLFALPYETGILIGIASVLIYTLFGGFAAVAWTDFFQGLFLLAMIILVPVYALYSIGGTQTLLQNINFKEVISNSLFNNDSLLQNFGLFFGWGLGYFGQPHVLNKFMGISDVKDLKKAKRVGVSWHFLSLLASFSVGLISIAFFSELPENRDLIFIQMTKQLFSPFVSGFILCGILAATISTIDSQLIVLTTVISDDLYKNARPNASKKALLTVSRISMVIICLFAFTISICWPNKNIYSLVQYAWSGLGASFGPLLFFALYSNFCNKYGAIAGILTGSFVSGLWPSIKNSLGYESLNTMPELIPGFFLSILAIVVVSLITKEKKQSSSKA
jgi:sodium/proline symporter